jgi:NAD(P)H-hydrate epimerase
MSLIADRLYTAEQVRRLDACAIDEFGIPGYTLMNRAGVSVFEAARSRFTSAQRWLILCGGGNNAGDGYVVARLARQAGLEVAVYALREPAQLKGDAARAAGDWLESGGEVRAWPVRGRIRADLVIDALLGTGLDREVGGAYRKAVEWIRRQRCPVVAIDIPSGLHADSGRVMGVAVEARLTVSFIGQKRGLFTADGPDHAGETQFDDLGTPPGVHDLISDSGIRIRESIIEKTLSARPRNSHKGHYGHVLVVGGAPGMSGAARLAGEAALRSGAGLVTVATHPCHASVLNLARPELMVAATATPAELEPLLERATVLAVGPGLGQQDWGEALLEAGLGHGKPLVLDADGLNLLAKKPRQRSGWVLTPHPAEAARLLGCDTHTIQSDRVGWAISLARQTGAVVVLKGCGTVVARPDGAYGICTLGNAGMATAGSGDVLTGVIAGLMAQGASPWRAAQAGVAAHAAAGDRVALAQGMRGMLASDISAALPTVLNP